MMHEQEKIHAKEMKSAVEEGLSQCKSVKCRLESEHKRDVTALVLEHDNSLTKIKTKAKAAAKSAKAKGAATVERSRRSSAAYRHTLKVSN